MSDPMAADGDGVGFIARHDPGVDRNLLTTQAVDGVARLDKLRGSLAERPININSFAGQAYRLAGLYHLLGPTPPRWPVSCG